MLLFMHGKFASFPLSFTTNLQCRVQRLQDQLATDLVRVDSLFNKAMEAGIDIQVFFVHLNMHLLMFIWERIKCKLNLHNQDEK